MAVRRKNIKGKKVEVIVTFESKYDNERKDRVIYNKMQYDNAVEFQKITGTDAEEIEKEYDENSHDDRHTYYRLVFSDGEVMTFRDTYTDIYVTERVCITDSEGTDNDK